MVRGSIPLVQLNTRNYAVFYNDLKKHFGKYLAIATTMGKWVNPKGGGFYTRIGANAAKTIIREAIDTGGTSIGASWPDSSQEQTSLSRETLGYNQTWKFQGKVYSNIVARRHGKGYSVGIDRRKVVKVTGFRTLAKNKTVRKMPIEVYASFVEFGTEWQEKRPLFAPSAIKFTQKFVPKLNDVVFHSLARVVKTYSVSKVRSRSATVSATETVSSATVRRSAGLDSSNPDKDFGSVMSDLALNARLGTNGIGVIDYQGDIDKSAMKRMEVEDTAEAKSVLTSVTGDASDFENWIKNNPELAAEYGYK